MMMMMAGDDFPLWWLKRTHINFHIHTMTEQNRISSEYESVR